MVFEINSFTRRLIDLFINSKQMPNMGGEYTNKYGFTQSDDEKHKSRPTPRDLISQIATCMIQTLKQYDNITTFDLGNEHLEQYFPYYHILQQAPVIMKKNRGTRETKGSQAKIKNRRKRDYERVSFNGETYSKEYTRKVDGARSQIENPSYWKDETFENSDASSYVNKHYRYIDNICEEIAPILATEYGLTIKAVIDSGLQDEYSMQLIDIFNSFEEE